MAELKLVITTGVITYYVHLQRPIKLKLLDGMGISKYPICEDGIIPLI